MHSYKIAVIAGDGIGREVVPEGIKVLDAVAKKFGHTLELSEGLIGGIAIHKTGTPLPKDTLDKALARVGFMAQSPTGEGCAAAFDHITFRPGAPGDLRDGS